MISIQVFSFRAGKNLGNKSFLFSDLIFEKSNEVLEQFMIFFYSENTIPKEILLSQKLKNTKIIRDLLKKNNDQIVSIKVPKKGKKKFNGNGRK